MEEISNIPAKNGKKRVVIIGGGFAGLKAARKLKDDYQVVFLDRNNHHVFQPLLYQVATSGIEPSAISFPFRKIFRKRKNFHIRICEALQVVPQQKRVDTSAGYIIYDYLIIATGCTTNYFGNDSVSRHAMSLKTTAEALFNRNQVLENFEKAQNARDDAEKRRLMTFAIVGGGATGIELSGALSEMKRFILPRDYPDMDLDRMHIILIDAGLRLLPTFSEQSSEDVRQYFLRHGVEVRLGGQVTDYSDGVLRLADGSSIPAANVYWVAGVRANALAGLAPETYGPGNRLKVNAYNQVPDSPDIFAVGDTALMVSDAYPKGHPQVVQPAIQQAANVVENIRCSGQGRPMRPFVYRNKGAMATIGRNNAIVELKRLRFDGFPAWAIWLFIHLMSIVGVKNKLFIFFDWMWSYFTHDPSLRLLIRPVRNEPSEPVR